MPIIHRSNRANRHMAIVSLCDYSGQWCKPYVEAGYTVIQFDLKHGDDVTLYGHTVGAIASVLSEQAGATMQASVVGVLAAPPCTDFASSGARWWADKDMTGSTDKSLAIARACKRIIDVAVAANPACWWALENPVGRLSRLMPDLGVPWYFHPCDYAGWATDPATDAYTKRTGIWGTAVKPAQRPVEPVMYEKTRADGRIVRGSWMWANLGGKSERTKALRSNTPEGFARAFACANR